MAAYVPPAEPHFISFFLVLWAAGSAYVEPAAWGTPGLRSQNVLFVISGVLQEAVEL